MQPFEKSDTTAFPYERCPHCGTVIHGIVDPPLSWVKCPSCSSHFVVGQVVDQFEVVDILSTGASGMIFKAHDAGLDRDIALKLPRCDEESSQSRKKRLASEASILGRLQHPHIARVFSSGTSQGRVYTASELCTTGSLHDRVSAEGPLSEADAIEMTMQAADGLDAAAKSGLVHTRVWPRNIFFSAPHFTKVGNFGLAVVEDSFGPCYCAPEILKGQAANVRSDIYSLGATFYFAMMGHPPFQDRCSNLDDLLAAKAEAIQPPAGGPPISEDTLFFLRRVLHADPTKRFQNYSEVIEKLKLIQSGGSKRQPRPVAAGSGVKASPARVTAQPTGVAKASGTRKSMKLLLIAGSIFSSALVVGALWLNSNRVRSELKPATSARPTFEMATGEEDEGMISEFGPEFGSGLEQFRDGSYAKAAETFHHVAEASSLPHAAEWALLLEALAQNAAGKGDKARQTFAQLHDRPIPKKTAEMGEEPEFLRKLSGLALEKGTTSPTLAPLFHQENHEAIALLALGLKNWSQKDQSEAVIFFRQFQLSKPTGKSAWIGELKPVASKFQDQITAAKMASENRTSSANRPLQINEAPAKSEAATDRDRNYQRPTDDQLRENAVPAGKRSKITPGTYRLVNADSLKDATVRSEKGEFVCVELPYQGLKEQQWEIFPSKSAEPGVYNIRSAKTGRMLDLTKIPYMPARNTYFDVSHEKRELTTQWIISPIESEKDCYHITSATLFGNLASNRNTRNPDGGLVEVKVKWKGGSTYWRLERVAEADTTQAK